MLNVSPKNGTQGGTSAAPPYFNDQNRADAHNYWSNTHKCQYLVGWQAEAHEPLFGMFAGISCVSGHMPIPLDARQWRILEARPFLDAVQSPSLYRALYLPGLSQQHNVYANYTLYTLARS